MIRDYSDREWRLVRRAPFRVFSKSRGIACGSTRHAHREQIPCTDRGGGPRICITATGQDLDATIDQPFGRAQFFLFVDSETPNIEAVRNHPGTHGAGIRAAQIVAEKGASVVITGRASRNTHQALAAAGVAICVGATGLTREGLQEYQAGCLSRAETPTRREHPWSARCQAAGEVDDSRPVCDSNRNEESSR